MRSQTDKREFWNNKIIPWESSSYSPSRLWGSPLRARRDLFLRLSRERLRGRTVFEGGCGSGQLLSQLFEAGISRYVGCDLSTVAIKEAKERAAKLGLAPRTEFIACDIADLPEIHSDFSFSLGLLDWLDDGELSQLFLKSKSASYLHSFSERRLSIVRALHRAYVWSAYGRRDLSYTPRYRAASLIEDLMSRAGGPRPAIYRNSKMSFSAFAYHWGEFGS